MHVHHEEEDRNPRAKDGATRSGGGKLRICSFENGDRNRPPQNINVHNLWKSR